ncbi:hypothetical protein VIGAN_02024300, partial [Vigna angularis var. angularis]
SKEVFSEPLAVTQRKDLIIYFSIWCLCPLLQAKWHTSEPSLSLEERCNLESEIISHPELESEHIIPSVAAIPSFSA